MSATGFRLLFAAVLALAIGAAFHSEGKTQRVGFPSLAGATEWLNSPPLTPAGLRGKVVLVDFWTFTCINWLRTLPYVRAWAAKYKDQGLVVIGVHTPEFSIERDAGDVRRMAKQFGVEFPIALDPEYAVWRAFDNEYWPALYLIDAQGQVRHRQFGEGGYEQSEQVIQKLLAEAGSQVDRRPAAADIRPLELSADSRNLRSLETYVGRDRAERFASREDVARNGRRTYSFPDRLALNDWALSGEWTVGGEAALSNERSGRIAYRFHARDLNLVMAPATRGTPVRFRVLIDGKPPGAAHGIDVDEQGSGAVTEPRLYQLIRQPGSVVDRRFELEFLDPGGKVLDFTFG
ncbi:MAG TPA: thioredoxin family protein [Myxococcales bacterium]|nr:thioredoxin family protein [Myxococcales bacterium]